MPAEELVGFQDKQRTFPVLDATGKEDEPEAVGLPKGRSLDLPLEDDQLLTKKCILGNEFRLAACQVGGHTENHRMAGRLGETQKGVLKSINQTDNQWHEPMQEDRHVG